MLTALNMYEIVIGTYFEFLHSRILFCIIKIENTTTLLFQEIFLIQNLLKIINSFFKKLICTILKG